jgi:uncharacterized alkaline shock family protein YloU
MPESESPSKSQTTEESKVEETTKTHPAKTSASPAQRSERQSGEALQTEHGTTTIASGVVAKIAALATQEIPGVHAMGKSLTRTLGTIKAKVPGTTQADTQGVSVEVGERQAAIDVDIVVQYGHSIVEVAEAIRQNVIDRIEGMTGLEVVEVNVGVDDLYLEGSEDDDEGSRVE